MCCDHGMPTSTFSPFLPAMSSSQTGGTVKTRAVFAPISAISAKSCATRSGGGNCVPSAPGAKGP